MAEPWYRRVRRWGQTNLTEADPPRYDTEFWRDHWKRTRVRGVIVNAGGIVAYYPSDLPLSYRARHLGNRDLFGEICRAAHDDGLAVLARMDSSRADERFYQAHPDWFCVGADGAACRAQDRYIACVNGPYYRQYLPQVLGEIIDRYRPEGFTDNSWSGLGRGTICHCASCSARFAKDTNAALPKAVDWDDPTYRRWIAWSYACRVELWDANNAFTRSRGGEDCLWLGMLNADPVGQSRALHDLKALGERSTVIMCDQQSRDRANGFEQNGLNGKLLHGVAGWDALIPQSMAMYVRGERPFRLASNPPGESRLWMIEGLAGGISPWWHHIGAHHEDHRQFDTAEPVMRWHSEHERYLYDRRPLASVGIVWSQQNIDFFGRDEPEDRVAAPMRGWVLALTRARIPYVCVHADLLEQQANDLAVLILPELAAMSEAQVRHVRSLVQRGKSLIASGHTSLFDQWGTKHEDFALADLLGAHLSSGAPASQAPATQSWERYESHTYLRLPPAGTPRHPVLRGLDRTDIISFGGTLLDVTAVPEALVPLTFVPPLPIYPPEFCWMRTPQTTRPALVLRDDRAGGRVAYLPADIDRCAARYQLPDHLDLLANLARWAAGDNIPLAVSGPGYVDCHLYRQDGRTLLHLVNLTHARGWPGYVEEHPPVGPFQIAVECDRPIREARMLVAGSRLAAQRDGRWVRFTLPSLADHELIVLE